MTERVLDTAPNNPASQAIADLKTCGTKDLFRLISKASSNEMGFMRSTKAMDTGDGVLVQVSTLHKGVPAESVAFVPGVHIEHGPTIDQPYVLVNTATGRPVNCALADEQPASGSSRPVASEEDDEGPAIVEQFPVPKGYADTNVEQLTLALQRQEFVVAASNPHTAYLWDGSNSRLEAIKAFCKSLYGDSFNVARLKQKVKTEPGSGTLRLGEKHRLRVGDVAIMYPSGVDFMPLHEYAAKFVLHYPHRAMVNLLDDNRALNESLNGYGNQLRDEHQQRRLLDAELLVERTETARAENAAMDLYMTATNAWSASTAKLCARLRKHGSPQRCLPNAAHLKRLSKNGPITASDGTDHEVGLQLMADIVRGDYSFYVIAPMFAADRDGRVRMDSICSDLRGGLYIDCQYDTSREEDVLILNGETLTEMQYAVVGIVNNDFDDESTYFVLETGTFDFEIDSTLKKKARVRELLTQMKQHLDNYRLYVR